MELFKKILFPVDLSEVSPIIAPYVGEMAARFDAEIHLLFVARILQHFTSIYVPHPSVSKFEAEIVQRDFPRRLLQSASGSGRRCRRNFELRQD
jgi:hypothetical protein